MRPDEAVSASAVAIHHIDDVTLASAPGFGQVWPELLAFIGDAVVIGHTLGFDLAVFEGECERATARFSRPRMLDTRLLAQVAEPNLASFTLEGLASWLGVEIENRHSALGDAVATARIFCALVPKLRAGGIRTLGEGFLQEGTKADVASGPISARVNLTSFRECTRFVFLNRQRIGGSGYQPKIASIAK
jgi:CBS domain-containing protein